MPLRSDRAVPEDSIEISIQGSAAESLKELSEKAGDDPDKIISDALGLYEWLVAAHDKGLSVASIDDGNKVVDQIVASEHKRPKRGSLRRILRRV